MALDVGRGARLLLSSEKLFPSGLMHIPYVSLVDDTTIRLRDNGMMRCLRVDGLDSLTADTRDLELVQRAVAAVVAQLPVGFTIYVHRVSRPVQPSAELVPYEGIGFAREIDYRWMKELRRRGLRDRSLTISIVRHGAALKNVPLFSRKKDGSVRREDERAREELSEVIRFLRTALGDVNSRMLTAASGELLGFLGSIQTAVEAPIARPKGVAVLADTVCLERVTFKSDHFELSDGPYGDRVGTVRVLKDYAPESWVTIFDDVALPGDYVITQSFSPLRNSRAADMIARQRKVMRATDDARVTAAEQLQLAHEDVLSQRLSLGEHQMTVTLLADSVTKLKEMVSELETVGAQNQTFFVKDRLVQKAHYFSQYPGNRAYRVRPAIITNQNFADFASLHRASMGRPGASVPWGSPVALFPGFDGSLRRFSFHSEGKPSAAPSPGHTVVIGRTGSGKTVLAAFLMAQLARLDARVVVFDYRRGLEMATRALGGSYAEVVSGRPTGLNPLQLETDKEGIDWLSDWLGRMLKPQGGLSTEQAKVIFESCERNARARADLRTWEKFATLFASTDDEGDLKNLVAEWAPGGRFGWVFGESEQDNFSLDGDIVGFDLTQILDAESERERMAVLSYIFRRLERQLRDERRTVVIIDEAWKAVDNPYFAEKIKGWLVTLRKLNAVVVMMTQNPAQLTNSAVGADIYSSFATQLLLPNPKAQAEEFEPLRLNEKELGFVLGTTHGRNVLIRDDDASTVVSADLRALGKLVQVLGGGASGEDVVGKDYRDGVNFWERAL